MTAAKPVFFDRGAGQGGFRTYPAPEGRNASPARLHAVWHKMGLEWR